jgi:aminopeptidase
MTDPNLERLADIMLDYCFETVDFGKAWKQDEKRLWMRYEAPADKLAQVITEKVYDRGGNVFLDQTPSWLNYTFFTRASEDVLKESPDYYLFKLNHSAARLSVLSDTNTKSLANVNPDRRAIRSKAMEPIFEEVMKTDIEGNFITPWCSLIFPTEAYAQDTSMSLPEFEQYVYKAMYLDHKKPVEKCRGVATTQEAIIKNVLKKTKMISVVDEADDTKLTMSVEGHRWINADGHLNFPDGEVFNAPVKTSVKGVLTIPSLPQYDHGGPEVRDIRLEFKDGKVVKWDAQVGKSYLDKFFTKNPGADYIGEVAFGCHPKLDKITKQILLDEKIGGTVHFAMGRAYDLHVLGDGDRSGLNRSAVHWDLIKDMRFPTAYVQVDDRFKLTWDKDIESWMVEELY